MVATELEEDDIVALVKDAVRRAGSLRELARRWGISAAYLSDTLNGRRTPGPSILEPLGYERHVVVTFRRKS